MFPKRYFAARAFAPHYFPPIPGGEIAEVIAGGRRVFGEPLHRPGVVTDGTGAGRIVRNGIARARIKRG